MPSATFAPSTWCSPADAEGLADDAEESEIVRAHRALIKTYHPDHGGSTAEAAI